VIVTELRHQRLERATRNFDVPVGVVEARRRERVAARMVRDLHPNRPIGCRDRGLIRGEPIAPAAERRASSTHSATGSIERTVAV
jgi:hypothetical protein